MQQVRPSIWALLSKKARLKTKAANCLAYRRESGIGVWRSRISWVHWRQNIQRGKRLPQSLFSGVFFPLRSPLPHCVLSHRPGKRWENCWLASMEAEVPLGHSFSPVFGRSWWRSTCQRWAWSHMTLISVGIFALDWPRTRCWKIIHVGSRYIYITMGICALESV